MKQAIKLIAFLLLVALAYILTLEFFIMKGDFNYNKANYIVSAKMYKNALFLKADKEKIKQKYLMSLFKAPQVLWIQKEIYDFSQSDIPSVSEPSKLRIKALKQKALSPYKEHYISNAVYNTQIMRWDETQFPLRVYYDSSLNSYEDAIIQAFDKWHIASGGFFKFKFTPSINDANIIITASNETPVNCSPLDTKCLYGVGTTTPSINHQTLTKMNIVLNIKNLDGALFTKDSIRGILIHEIGHALGIMGHTSYPTSIMNITANQEQGGVLTYADINTAILLYKIAPDISNFKKSIDNSEYIYPKIILGNEKQMNEEKILEANRYIKKAGSVVYGYIDLASAYFNEKKYDKALETLDVAVQYATDKKQLSNIYYNRAVVFAQTEQYNNAINSAVKAYEYDSEPEVYLLYGELLFQQKRIPEAIKVGSELVEYDPKNIDYGIFLTRVYLKYLNAPKARETLQNLIKNNSDAQNDKRVEPYKFLVKF